MKTIKAIGLILLIAIISLFCGQIKFYGASLSDRIAAFINNPNDVKEKIPVVINSSRKKLAYWIAPNEKDSTKVESSAIQKPKRRSLLGDN